MHVMYNFCGSGMILPYIKLLLLLFALFLFGSLYFVYGASLLLMCGAPGLFIGSSGRLWKFHGSFQFFSLIYLRHLLDGSPK